MAAPRDALVVHVDGYVAADGIGAWAVVVDGRPTLSGRVAGEPIHLVEWRAIAAALAWLEVSAAPRDVRLVTDSALVERGLASRRPEMHGEAGEIRAASRQALARLAARGIRVRVQRVPREANREADGAARRAVDEPQR